MKLRPWKNLEKKMKCGPSICGMDGIQIRQRRISRVPLGTQKKTCMDFSIHALLAVIRLPSSTLLVGHFVPALALSGSGEPVVLVLGVAALHYNTSFRQLLQQATGHHRSGNVQTDFGCVAMNGAGGHTFAQAALFNPLS